MEQHGHFQPGSSIHWSTRHILDFENEHFKVALLSLYLA